MLELTPLRLISFLQCWRLFDAEEWEESWLKQRFRLQGGLSAPFLSIQIQRERE